ncbi:MAG: helix-turn-helix domain-containing protein [Bacteroidetes bacterium]|nr:helix-turn-helix domain-containing protein [Bacteroidota bacterium]
MEDILLSQKQYQAVIDRLNKINADVTTLKQKTAPEAGYIDNYDLLKLLQVTNRTVQRWRLTGKLPYSRIGKKYYYRADLILERCRVRREPIDIPAPSLSVIPELSASLHKSLCRQCPLYYIRRMFKYIHIRPG